ncbi:uncharacterized protein E0L32_003485 [Thyridium curvatum]|uniref:Zn(2)-C6 fungal-type domain-containing protein n=1 Tax=Thyridium curvatum TaxID=1093900 RepID=A0A507BBP5_9PEZI|nr:uncharacterized protein E0L32_003485 [Thyridium curvatum]TPX16923.1 hypothetical protein E0L32_003485 [Thyridium curvatum]
MAAFTALNGGSPKSATTEGLNGGLSTIRRESEEHTGRPGQISEPRTAASTADPSPTQPERPGSWSGPSLDRPAYQPAPAYSDNESTHKRKRSDSMEPRRGEYDLSRHDRPVEESDPSRPRSPSRDAYTPQRDYRPYGDEHRDHGDSWYSQSRADERSSNYEPQSAAPNSANTDEQIETLRRATGQMDQDYPQTSPDGDDRSVIYGGQYTPEQRRDGVMQSDPKKRKRNFSNRTKTGCLTCRKRKKKCDETKPECSNCVRGGFVCAGYPPQRGTWPKPEAKTATIQIESKDPTYIPPGAYGMPQSIPITIIPHQQKREPLPTYRGQPLRIEPPQGRPLQTDDDRPTASTLPSASIASPDNKLSALSAYTNTANIFPTPVSAAAPTPFPDRTPKEYQRVPPLHDLSRTEPDLPAHGTTLPQINILHATRTNSPITSQTSGVQATAQLALSHTPQYPSGGRQRREKEEMISGRQYYPFDKELVLERERCSAACWRFNNATNPNNGVSPGERARLFRDILQPREGVQISPTMTSPVTHTGRIGSDVVVEAPFVCDYGYNINIGKNVLIGRNCTIIDPCEVSIGDNVVIGPNVCIYTATMPTDYRRRQGSRGAQFGKPVVIEEDVFIGANVVILPGVKIGRGTTVGAGSLVTKDLAKYCVCYGSPAEVRRGLASV